jgi:hypothetical protein
MNKFTEAAPVLLGYAIALANMLSTKFIMLGFNMEHWVDENWTLTRDRNVGHPIPITPLLQLPRTVSEALHDKDIKLLCSYYMDPYDLVVNRLVAPGFTAKNLYYCYADRLDPTSDCTPSGFTSSAYKHLMYILLIAIFIAMHFYVNLSKSS